MDRHYSASKHSKRESIKFYRHRFHKISGFRLSHHEHLDLISFGKKSLRWIFCLLSPLFQEPEWETFFFFSSSRPPSTTEKEQNWILRWENKQRRKKSREIHSTSIPITITRHRHQDVLMCFEESERRRISSKNEEKLLKSMWGTWRSWLRCKVLSTDSMLID